MAKKEKEQKETPVEETVQTPEASEVPEAAEQAPEVPETDEVNPWEEKYNAEHDARLRLAAEYDNFRKRTIKEKDAAYGNGKADAVTKVLPIYDNLERAVATDADPDSPHRKGLELIFSQFKEILKKLGVEEMEALGQPFDPQRHNAVMHIESEDLGENVVSQVFQAGFTLDGKVVRFAIVQVAN